METTEKSKALPSKLPSLQAKTVYSQTVLTPNRLTRYFLSAHVRYQFENTQ